MKLLLTTIAAVLVVGCGESQQSVPAPETPTAEPVAEVPTLPSSSPPEAELAWLLDNSVQAGNIQVVKHNIAIGADVNSKDESGSTPLHSAAISGHKEIAELLIAKGADVNARNNDGETPLDWAIEENHTETADLLRKHGGKTGEELKAEGK
jgi:PBP1b-binding outer membrane lipoprotein LpoB